ncbi:hypothetical protein F4692_000745 [Nocardioides cavernae]|uniref:NYN domain-containing protein n=1 Tax=Nocardioides cavernae TaxID=1921566 RepID=A0A7Y9H110_9ACTN|nr:hypothetical protein [Nocardioides cavernae]NYE35641.1 hypothetical protein [Nocardioides cavernae]
MSVVSGTLTDMGGGVLDEQARSPAALLWDMDNMPGKRGQLLGLARFLSLVVPDDAYRYAAARRPTWKRTKSRLEPLGFEVVSGGQSTSGADRRLCDIGRVLSRNGCHHFTVVSNDRFFSCLSTLGTVHVVTLDPANLSTRLAQTAESITSLHFDGTNWRLDALDATQHPSQRALAPPRRHQILSDPQTSP